MTIYKGKKVTQRGGAGAGRGDDAHGVTRSKHDIPFHELVETAEKKNYNKERKPMPRNNPDMGL